MYEPRRKVLWIAIFSRLFVLLLQLIFNILLPDHDAGVFISPINSNETISFFDKIINTLFGGLTRWDAQYFIHIARYGYTYENTLAFFPLYPMSVRCTSRILKKFLFNLNDNSVIIVAAVLINFICFVKSAVILYDLSRKVLGDKTTAYKAAILYCINPASIFFTAAYSESMFAYLTFYIMISAIKSSRFVCLPIGLSAIIRSNGLVNTAYPLYFWMQDLLFFSLPKFLFEKKNRSIKSAVFSELLNIFAGILWIFNTILLSITPFVLLQTYNYILFCTDRGNTTLIPAHVINYGVENNLILPGSSTKSSWCSDTIPFAYSYIQEKYWNVGFLKYYEIKQIPNFILAFPILYIMIRCIIEYFIENKYQLYRLKFLKTKKYEKITRLKRYPVQMFPFIIHGLFLTIFCILFVHIQISTRLLGSASPLMYWFCATIMSHRIKSNDRESYENKENMFSRWRTFIMTQREYTKRDKLILIYFLGYTVVGTFMYSNFLPWT